MISFLLCIAIMLCGYLFYSRRIDRLFGADDRPTPAVTRADGVDFIVLPPWKLFLIQLLNIAGLGPILGALNGALFGPVCYLWITLGTVFLGGVHDYFSGMLSMRNGGSCLPELAGAYLGKAAQNLLRILTVFLLVLVGVVFSKGPAGLIAMLTPERYGESFFLVLIIAYYFIATFVPVDAVIGRIYPLFGVCLLVMAFGISGSLLFTRGNAMPELWQHFANEHPQGIPVFPFLFVTVACGAVSGFHATQSPMIARCCKSERQGRRVFYGAMVAEGIIALIWAAAGVTCYESTQALLAAGGGINAVVYEICSTTMGKLGAVLAMLGVIVCPVTSGDTAYRSARLALADVLHYDQSDWKKRLLLTVPLLGLGALISLVDYQIVWRYFSWFNQALATICLWSGAVFLARSGKPHWCASLPACFMSAVATAYFLCAGECLGGVLQPWLGAMLYPLSVASGILVAGLFLLVFRKRTKKGAPSCECL